MKKLLVLAIPFIVGIATLSCEDKFLEDEFICDNFDCESCLTNPTQRCCDQACNNPPPPPPPFDGCDGDYYENTDENEIQNAMYHLKSGDLMGGMDPDGVATYLVRPPVVGSYLEWEAEFATWESDVMSGDLSKVDGWPTGVAQHVNFSGGQEGTINGSQIINGVNIYVEGMNLEPVDYRPIFVDPDISVYDGQDVTLRTDAGYNDDFVVFEDLEISSISYLDPGPNQFIIDNTACHAGSGSRTYMVGRNYTGMAPHLWYVGIGKHTTNDSRGDAPYQYGLPETPGTWFTEPPLFESDKYWKGGALWRRNFSQSDYESYSSDINHYWIDLAQTDDGASSQFAYLYDDDLTKLEFDINAIPNNMSGLPYQNQTNVYFTVSNVEINGGAGYRGATAYIKDGNGANTQLAGSNGVAMTETIVLASPAIGSQDWITYDWAITNNGQTCSTCTAWNQAATHMYWGGLAAEPDIPQHVMQLTFDVTFYFSGSPTYPDESNYLGTYTWTIDLIDTRLPCMPYPVTPDYCNCQGTGYPLGWDGI